MQSRVSVIFQYLWSSAGAISIIYGLIFLINAAGIEFNTLVRGQGVVSFPIDIQILGRGIDPIIFGVSLIFFLSYSFYLRFRHRDEFKASRFFLIFPLILFLLAVIEVSSLARWIAGGFIPGNPFSDSSWAIPLLEMQLANVLYPWLPRIMLIFLFSWLLGYLLRRIKPLERFFSRMHSNTRDADSKGPQANYPYDKILLIFGLIIAVFIASYPYLPAVNDNPARLIGVDAPFYLEKLEDARGSSILESISIALSDNRTILHLLNILLHFPLQNSLLVMKVLPILLSVLLVLSTFFMVKVLTRNSGLAGLSALFTPIAFQQIIGMNAGFYANWLALVEVNLFFGVLLIALRDQKLLGYLFSLILSIIILFTHPWTWFVVMFSLSVYMFVGLWTRATAVKESFLILMVLTINVLADAVKGVVFTVGSGVEATSSSILSGFLLADLPNVIGVLESTFTTFLGGVLYNSVLILLATIGFLTIRDYKDRLNRVLLALSVSGLIGVFFFSSNFDSFLQARALYVIPFGIFAALGFRSVTEFFRRLANRAGVSDSRVNVLNLLLGFVLTVAMINQTVSMGSTVYPFLA